MDPRTAALVLTQIAAFLALRGDSRFKSKAYEQAARALVALDTDDLGALDRAGTLADTPGIGKATLAVVRDLIATGESRYLDELRADLPAGLLDLMNVPGLALARIHFLHETLGIDSLDSLELAARDGRLATAKGFGPKTAAKILRGDRTVPFVGLAVALPPRRAAGTNASGRRACASSRGQRGNRRLRSPARRDHS